MCSAQRENRPVASIFDKRGRSPPTWAIGVFLTLRRFLQSDDPLSDFDPAAELQRVQELKKLGRIRPYSQGRSQLDPYTAELLALHDSGARPADLQAWLKMPPRRIKVAHSTVARWLQRTLDKRTSDRGGH